MESLFLYANIYIHMYLFIYFNLSLSTICVSSPWWTSSLHMQIIFTYVSISRYSSLSIRHLYACFPLCCAQGKRVGKLTLVDLAGMTFLSICKCIYLFICISIHLYLFTLCVVSHWYACSRASVLETLRTALTRLVLQAATYRRHKRSFSSFFV